MLPHGQQPQGNMQSQSVHFTSGSQVKEEHQVSLWNNIKQNSDKQQHHWFNTEIEDEAFKKMDPDLDEFEIALIELWGDRRNSSHCTISFHHVGPTDTVEHVQKIETTFDKEIESQQLNEEDEDEEVAAIMEGFVRDAPPTSTPILWHSPF